MSIKRYRETDYLPYKQGVVGSNPTVPTRPGEISSGFSFPYEHCITRVFEHLLFISKFGGVPAKPRSYEQKKGIIFDKVHAEITTFCTII